MDMNTGQVLMLDADPAGAYAVQRELERAGFSGDFRSARTREDFEHALQAAPPHVVISAHDAAGVAAREALEIVQQRHPDIPVIILSSKLSKLGEREAGELLEAGAWDHVPRERLADVAPTLRRALHSVKRSRDMAIAAVEVAERPYQRLFENACDGILIVDTRNGAVIDANPNLTETLGYARAELVAMPATALGDAAWQQANLRLQGEDHLWRGDVRLRGHGQEVFIMEALGRAYEAGAARVIQWHLRDETELRQAEAALRMREEMLRRIVDTSPDCISTLDLDARLIWISRPGRRAMQIDEAQDITGTRWLDMWRGQDRALAEAALASALAGGTGRFIGFGLTTGGAARWWDVIVTAIVGVDDKPERLLAVSRDVTELREAEAVLHESESQKRAILQSALDCIVTVDHLGRITEFNPASETVFGYRRKDAIGKDLALLLVPEPLRERQRRALALYLATQDPRLLGKRVEMMALRADGSTFPIELAVSRIGAQAPPAFVGFVRDISKRRSAEAEAREHAKQKDLISSFGQEALSWRDLEVLFNRAVDVARAGTGADASRILLLAADGQSLQVAAATGWDGGVPGRVVPAAEPDAPLRRLLRTAQPLIVEDLRQDDRLPASDFLREQAVVRGVEILIGDVGNPHGVLGVYTRDSTTRMRESMSFLQGMANILETAIARKAADEHVAYLSHFDAQTGLANRSLFHERIGQMLAQARTRKVRAGIMLVGLHDFKAINETYGHAAGDLLLGQVALRLQQCIGPGDTVARLRDDEFALGCSNASDASRIALNVADILSPRFTLGEHEVVVSASIGIAVYPNDGLDADTLITNADSALVQAKASGRNNQQFFTPDMNTRVKHRITLESQLRRALEKNEFVLHYQPQISARTVRICGAEALVRWQHPERGLLPPGDFIPAAEFSGLIVPIGQRVVDMACEEAIAWQRAGYEGLTMAVNASPAELRRGELAHRLRSTLDRLGLDPRLLEIELTESLSMDGVDIFIAALQAVKDVGVNIAIDDFGTGYSSLSYLQRFPIDKVKIDRAFVTDIDADRPDAPIVRAVIAMSHHLGLQVVAEGVENVQQSVFLQQYGCDILQGFLYGRPCSAVEFRDMVDARIDYARLVTGHRPEVPPAA